MVPEAYAEKERSLSAPLRFVGVPRHLTGSESPRESFTVTTTFLS